LRKLRRLALVGLSLVAAAFLIQAATPRRAAPPPHWPFDPVASNLVVIADWEHERLLIELGPVSLPAGASHLSIDQPQAKTVFPAGGWLRGMEFELVDGEGTILPREFLHHVNVIAPDKRELFSPIMRRIAAAGKETTPIRLPRLLGYRVEAGDSVLVGAHFHNPSDRSYDRVYLRAVSPFVSGDRWLAPLSVHPFYMDVMPPAGPKGYDLPPGRSVQSWEASPVADVRILGMGGHLHELAEALVLQDLTTGKVLWRAVPEIDRNGTILSMPRRLYLTRLGLRLRAGHTYRLTAIYENTTGEVIPLGGMGALGGIVVLTGGRIWPAVDREDPVYRLDVTSVLDGAYNDRKDGFMGHSHDGHH